MDSNNFVPKKALLVTRLIFISMFAASLTFMIIAFTIRTGKFYFRIDSTNPFSLSPLILFCIAIPAAYFYSKVLYGKVNAADPLKDKFHVYQNGLIIKLAACEGAALYSIVFFLISGNLFGILMVLAALSVMVIWFPNINKISNMISLSQPETEMFY